MHRPPGNRRCRCHNLLFAAALCTIPEVDVLEASHYRSAMRWLEPLRHAICLHITDQLRNRRPGLLQIICADRCADDFFSLFVQGTMTLGASSFAVHQRQHSSAGTEQFDQPVCSGSAQMELGCEFGNISGRRAFRITLQEAANRVSSSARFVPNHLVYLGGKKVSHGRLSMKTSKSVNLT